jgi:outer membrane putative beta-barrel porin/alpha-amylase
LQVVTQVSYALVDPDSARATSGLGDAAIETRYAVMNYREHRFGLDVGLGLELPTGDRRRELGDGRVAIEPSFTASAWFGPVNTQLNAGWLHALRNTGDEPDDEVEYNVALVYPIGRWFAVLEGDGESDRENTKYYVTPGVVWRTTERLELRVAVPTAVTRSAGDYGVIGGFTFEFEHLLHRAAGD